MSYRSSSLLHPLVIGSGHGKEVVPRKICKRPENIPTCRYGRILSLVFLCLSRRSAVCLFGSVHRWLVMCSANVSLEEDSLRAQDASKIEFETVVAPAMWTSAGRAHQLAHCRAANPNRARLTPRTRAMHNRAK